MDISCEMDAGKCTALLNWVKSVDSEQDIENLTQLRDGKVLLKAIRAMEYMPDDSTNCAYSNSDAWASIQDFLQASHQAILLPHVNWKLLSQGDEIEIAKVILLLLSMSITCVNKERFITDMTHLDYESQVQIRHMFSETLADRIPGQMGDEFFDILYQKVPVEQGEDFTVSPGRNISMAASSMSFHNTSPTPSHNCSIQAGNRAMFQTPAKQIFKSLEDEEVFSSIPASCPPLRRGPAPRHPATCFSIGSTECSPMREFLSSPVVNYKIKIKDLDQKICILEKNLQAERLAKEECEKTVLEKESRCEALERKMRDLSRLTVEKQQLFDEIDELHAIRMERDSLQKENSKLKHQLEKHNSHCNQSKDLKKELDEQLEQNEELRKQIKSLKVSLSSVIEDRKHTSDMEETFKGLQERNSLQQQEISHLLTQLHKLKMQNLEIKELYESKINDLKTVLDEKDSFVGEAESVGESMGIITEQRISELQEKVREMEDSWMKPAVAAQIQSELDATKETVKQFDLKVRGLCSEKMALEDDLCQSRQELAAKTAEVMDMMKNLAASGQRTKTTEAAADALKQRLEKVNRDKDEQKAHAKSLENQLCDSHSKVTKLQFELNMARTENETKASAIENHLRRLSDSGKKILDFEQQFRDLEKQASDLRTELEETQKSNKEQVKELESALIEAREQNDASDRAAKALQHDTLLLSADLDACNEQIANLQKMKSDLEVEISSVKNALEKEKAKMQSLLAKHRALDQDLESERKKLLEAQRRITRQNAEADSMQTSIAHLEAKCKQLEQDAQSKEEQFNVDAKSFERKIQSLEEELSQKKTKHQEAEEEFKRSYFDLEAQLVQSEAKWKSELEQERNTKDKEILILSEKANRLQEQKAIMEKQFEDVRTDMQANLKNLEATSASQTQKINELHAQVANGHELTSAKEELVSQLQEKLNSSESQYMALKTDLEHWKRRLEEKKVKNEVLESTISGLKEELKSTQIELQATVEEHRRELDESRSAFENATAMAEASAKSVEDLESKLRIQQVDAGKRLGEKEAELDAVQAQLAKTIMESEQRVSENMKISDELKAAQSDCSGKLLELEELKDKLDVSEQENCAHRQSVSDLEGKLHTQQEEFDKICAEKDSLVSELRTEFTTLSKDKDNVETEFRIFRDDVQEKTRQLGESITHLHEEKRGLMESVNALEEKNNCFAKAVQDLMQETELLKRDAGELHERLEEKEKKVSDLLQTISELGESVKIKQEEVDEVHNRFTIQDEKIRQYMDLVASKDAELLELRKDSLLKEETLNASLQEKENRLENLERDVASKNAELDRLFAKAHLKEEEFAATGAEMEKQLDILRIIVVSKDVELAELRNDSSSREITLSTTLKELEGKINILEEEKLEAFELASRREEMLQEANVRENEFSGRVVSLEKSLEEQQRMCDNKEDIMVELRETLVTTQENLQMKEEALTNKAAQEEKLAAELKSLKADLDLVRHELGLKQAEYNADTRKLQDEVAILQEDLALVQEEKQSQINEKSNALEKVQDKLESAEEQMSKLQEQVSSLQEQLQKVEEDASTSTERAQKLEEALRQAESGIEVLNQTLNTKVAQNEQFLQEIEAKKEELQLLKDTFKRERGESLTSNEKLKNEIAMLAEERNVDEIAKTETLESFAKLEAEMKNCVKAHHEEIQSLKNERHSLESECIQLREERKHDEDQMMEMRDKLQDMQQQLLESQRLNETLRNEKAYGEEKLEAIRSQFTEKYRGKQEKIVKLEKDLKDWQARADEQTAKYDNLGMKFSETRRQLNEAVNNLDQAHDEKLDLQEAIRSLKKKNEVLTSNSSQLSVKNIEEEKKIRQLSAEVRQLTAQLQFAERKIREQQMNMDSGIAYRPSYMASQPLPTMTEDATSRRFSLDANQNAASNEHLFRCHSDSFLDSPSTANKKMPAEDDDAFNDSLDDILKTPVNMQPQQKTLQTPVRKGINGSHISIESSLLNETPHASNARYWSHSQQQLNTSSLNTSRTSHALETSEEPHEYDWGFSRDAELRRLAELQGRNAAALPHLKSSYPIETQGQTPSKCDESVRVGDAAGTRRLLSQSTRSLQETFPSDRDRVTRRMTIDFHNTKRSGLALGGQSEASLPKRTSLAPGDRNSVSRESLRGSTSRRDSNNPRSTIQEEPEWGDENRIEDESKAEQADPRRMSMMFEIPNTPKRGVLRPRNPNRKVAPMSGEHGSQPENAPNKKVTSLKADEKPGSPKSPKRGNEDRRKTSSFMDRVKKPLGRFKK